MLHSPFHMISRKKFKEHCKSKFQVESLHLHMHSVKNQEMYSRLKKKSSTAAENKRFSPRSRSVFMRCSVVKLRDQVLNHDSDSVPKCITLTEFLRMTKKC